MCIVPLWATPEHLKRFNPLYAPKNKRLAAPEVDLSRTFRELATWSHNMLHTLFSSLWHTFVTGLPKYFVQIASADSVELFEVQQKLTYRV